MSTFRQLYSWHSREGGLSVALEFKAADLWVGAFFRRIEPPLMGWDLWVCVVPCFPIHVHRRRWEP